MVLVHGAWHGSWCWTPVAERLRARGLTVTTVDLPGAGRNEEGGRDLTGHAQYLSGVLAGLEQPSLVCAHSYGGAVLSEAVSSDSAARRLVFLTAFQLEEGEVVLEFNSPADPSESAVPDFEVTGDELMPTVNYSRDAFYGQLTGADADWALPQLTPEIMGTIASPLTRAGWKDLESTYIVCGQDRAIAPSVQRAMAGRAGTRYEISDAGHSPMISHPAEVEAILVAECLRIP